MPSGPPPSADRHRAVVEGAARLLAEEGPAAVSVRRLAELAGGSTQLVYTLFGGKRGVADAVHAEGFDRLRTAVSAAAAGHAEGSPERVVAVAHAYRDFALADPHLFTVVLGPRVPSFSPSDTVRTTGSEQTLGRAVAEVQACLDAGTLTRGTAEDIATRCWVSVHGLVVLEVAGLVDEVSRDLVDRLLHGVLAAHLP